MDFQTIFQNNEYWIAEKPSTNPDYFSKLSRGQNPEFLCIGFNDLKPLEQ